MKALVRGEEVITEPFSDWVKHNIAFLTGSETDTEGNPIKGDGWTLVENYTEEGAEAVEETAPISDTAVDEKPVETDSEPIAETVSIGGREYTLDDLRKLINQ